MNLERVQKIAEAVLYEGYMLYPYRASAVKNQQRWNFGVLCPRSYSESQNGSESWSMQTECLLQGNPSAHLDVKIRFLQIVNRSVGKLVRPLRELTEGTVPECELVDSLNFGGHTFIPWQEAAEREVVVESLNAVEAPFHHCLSFDFPSSKEFEPLRAEDGLIAGVVLREWEKLSGSVDIDGKFCTEGVVKVIVRIHNFTSYQPSQHLSRADALPHSLVSAHTILGLEGGQFISMLDPPAQFKDLIEACRNLGTWPVLVGDEGDRSTMLSSPIILYDYPQIAPESPGGLFDGTEIDEILSLRILTMTDEEKREMRQSDQRARQILERTENMPPEQFMKLHGAMREMRSLNRTTIEEAR